MEKEELLRQWAWTVLGDIHAVRNSPVPEKEHESVVKNLSKVYDMGFEAGKDAAYKGEK